LGARKNQPKKDKKPKEIYQKSEESLGPEWTALATRRELPKSNALGSTGNYNDLVDDNDWVEIDRPT